LLDLISAAGGVTPNAGKGGHSHARADLTILWSCKWSKLAASRFKVDISPVTPSWCRTRELCMVVGDVGKPGGFLIENTDRLTVLQAIALRKHEQDRCTEQIQTHPENPNRAREMPVPLKKILSNDVGDVCWLTATFSSSPPVRRKMRPIVGWRLLFRWHWRGR